jgi:hypothetical protein
MRRWAVELTGKNSVRPSTTPSRAASKYVFNHPPGILCRIYEEMT